MLEKDRYGMIRYKKYNVEKYPTIPYYKWFFVKLNYFISDHRRAAKNKNSIVKKMLFLGDILNDGIIYSIPILDSLDSTVFISELLMFLEAYSRRGDGLFRVNAYTLFVLRLEGYSNADIANFLMVANKTIVVWIKKLRNLIIDFLNRGECVYKYKVYADNLIRM